MKEVIILGGGASLEEGINLGLWDKIKEKEVWSINYAFLTMPFLPKREIWVDISFFRNNIEKLQNLYKQGVECHAKKHQHYATIPEIKTYYTTRDPKEISEKLYIGKMGLAGFFALHLAIKENFNPIFILGYDFGNLNITDKKTHYYQDKLNIYSTGIGKPELYRNKDNTVKEEVKDFDILAIEAQQQNLKIYNVSLISNIFSFEKISWEDFFTKLNET